MDQSPEAELKVRKIVAVNATIVVATEKKSKKKPNVSFRGSEYSKSSNSKGDVRMERKITSEVNELHKEITSMTVKTRNKAELSKTGRPCSLDPPGAVKAAAKTKPATRIATVEHDSDVPFIHSCAAVS